MKSGCFKMLMMLVLGVVVMCGFTSCESMTPAKRAAENPGVMDRLSEADRNLVLSGTISEGMSKDAVIIAWGRPDSISHGSMSGKPVETWRYATMRPIYRPYYGVGLGYGYGYRGHFYPGATFGMGPDYVPVTSSICRFRNNRVIGWETADVR